MSRECECTGCHEAALQEPYPVPATRYLPPAGDMWICERHMAMAVAAHEGFPS